MHIRSFCSGDGEKLVDLWNSAHPAYKLTAELMAKKLFLDSNFQKEDLLVVEEGGTPIAFAYVPCRRLPIDRSVPMNTQVGYICYFSVDPQCSVRDVGSKLLQACEQHHKNAGRSTVSTAYGPLYHTQGFSKTYDEAYIELFRHWGYAERESCRRKIDLTNYEPPQAYYSRKQQLETERFYIGALPYGALADFVDPESSFTKIGWPWEFRIRLANDPDLARARVAVYDGKIIGGCIFGDPNSDEGRFGPFGVSAELRGKGLGFVLFVDCLLEMKRRGIPCAWAQWTPLASAAGSLYDRVGFAVEDRFLSFSKEINH